MLISFNSRFLTFGALVCIFYMLYNVLSLGNQSQEVKITDAEELRVQNIKQQRNTKKNEEFIPERISKNNMKVNPEQFGFIEKVLYFFLKDPIDKQLIKFQKH